MKVVFVIALGLVVVFLITAVQTPQKTVEQRCKEAFGYLGDYQVQQCKYKATLMQAERIGAERDRKIRDISYGN